MTRDSFQCMEWGEENPYSEYHDLKKYYGGAFYYYVPIDGTYYDICRGKYETSMDSVSGLNEVVKNIARRDASSLSVPTTTASTSFIAILPYQEDWIRRKAFGYNNDDTCSSVACMLALEYIDHYNGDVVQPQHQLENLVYGSWTTASYVQNNYPNAHAFHRYLVEDCGIDAVSFAGDIVMGIDAYAAASSAIEETNLQVRWHLDPTGNAAKDCIVDDRPAMLTSTVAGDYSWHTMLIYGYREYTDGTSEWLVHPGWYSHVSNDAAVGYYRINTVWVSGLTDTFLYSFTYDLP